MTQDIVLRLHKSGGGRLIQDAAVEITALRAERDVLKHKNDSLSGVYTGLLREAKAERDEATAQLAHANERHDETLATLVLFSEALDFADSEGFEWPTDPVPCGLPDRARAMLKIVEAAAKRSTANKTMLEIWNELADLPDGETKAERFKAIWAPIHEADEEINEAVSRLNAMD